MNAITAASTYGKLTEPATLTIERLLPGPMDRVWAYLTQSDLRRQWLASGDMTLADDAPFTLTWRNDELAGSLGNRPEGFSEEHSMETRILSIDPPRQLSFAWGNGEVSFTLAPAGDGTLLTIVHRRISDRPNTLMIGAGWHAHLDVLTAIMAGTTPKAFWDNWKALKAEYETRLA